MSIKVRIPSPLRQFTQGIDVLEVSPGPLDSVLDQVVAKANGIEARLFKPGLPGSPKTLNRFVNIYVNDEDIRFLGKLQTPVKEGDTVSIVPAIAGG
jgi:sulfur-carrier protein